MVFTCRPPEVESGCPASGDGSREAALLDEGQAQTAFDILYPCRLPNSQRLITIDVVGDRGKQSVTAVWDGPFEITVRQSQVAPVVNADPAGASHIVLADLFPGIKVDLIEINDGSSRALYHLIWARGGMYYEVLAVGPPLQRRLVLEIARSLE